MTSRASDVLSTSSRKLAFWAAPTNTTDDVEAGAEFACKPTSNAEKTVRRIPLTPKSLWRPLDFRVRDRARMWRILRRSPDLELLEDRRSIDGALRTSRA